MEQPAIEILDSHRTMTVATVRPDGWPQATIVGYANEGWKIYFLVYRDSQKFENIQRDNRVAITVGSEPSEIRQIKAVYAGSEASEVTDIAERTHAWDLLARRHPNLTDLAQPRNADVATMVANCKYVSVLDYTKGLGHTEEVTL
jgi:nitroimidazol reductase NimA-like FMN-containing flavoprotein (pyridoxamine 5'-phosphate oxidase superfamily)